MTDGDVGKKPDLRIPENLDRMTPQEAWNAALDAALDSAGYHAFWDDGQYTMEDLWKLKIEPGPTRQSLGSESDD